MIRASCDAKTFNFQGDKNTFGTLPGLPESGGTCPGATTGPGGCLHVAAGRCIPDCYALKICKLRHKVENILQQNTALLLDESVDLRAEFIEEFDTFLRVFNKKKGPKPDKPFYRLFWSGDIPNKRVAVALAGAIKKFDKKINFWGYTRSFSIPGVLPPLLKLRNLVLFLSLDPCNEKEGLKAYRKALSRGAKLRIAYMSKTKPVVPGIRFTHCPVDTGVMPLKGACLINCRKCVEHSNVAIWFQS